MYSEAQLRMHIYDLQRFLRRIEQEQSYPQPLAADGIFGPETAAGVRDFQRMNGLPVTGAADYDTWSLIYSQYFDLVQGDALPGAVMFFPTGAEAKLSPGSKGASVLVLQLLLNTPLPHYSNLAPVAITGEYDQPTVNAVKTAQRAFKLCETGITDRATWEALAHLHNSLFERIPLSWQLGN